MTPTPPPEAVPGAALWVGTGVAALGGALLLAGVWLRPLPAPPTCPGAGDAPHKQTAMADGAITTAPPGPGSPAAPGWPPHVVARVNGRPILAVRLQRTLEGMGALSGEVVSDDGAPSVALEALIREELLFQRANALGITEHDEMIRRRAVQRVLDQARVEVTGRPVPEQRLRAYYRDQAETFRRQARVRMEQIFLPAGPRSPLRQHRKQQAEALHQRLELGEPWAAVTRAAGKHRPPVGGHGAWLGRGKLSEYYGERLAEAVVAAAPGEITPPLPSALGFHIVRVVERAGGELQAYEAVRPAVLQRFLRTESRRAVDTTLRELLAGAHVELAPSAPPRPASGLAVPEDPAPAPGAASSDPQP